MAICRLHLRKLRRQAQRSRRDQAAHDIVVQLVAEDMGVPVSTIRDRITTKNRRALALAKRLRITPADAQWLIDISRDGKACNPENMTPEHAQRTLTELRASRVRSLAAWERSKKATP
jgi:creatinine amidohydrolase/Fe(II)-dependent formamide hydrolase-like protein